MYQIMLRQVNCNGKYLKRKCGYHSFSFSGCGWLTPFHLGVIDVMKKEAYISNKSVFGGTSGGSIGALVACLDIDPKDACNLLINLSKKRNFKKNIDTELKHVLQQILPPNALEICNHRLHITITEATLTLPGKVVNKYDNIDQLIDIVCASCFIPVYSARRLTTTITGLDGMYLDGGVRAFMPPVGDIRVTPFPISFMKGFSRRYPHITLPFMLYPIPLLFVWSLFPPSEEILTNLFTQGQRAAERYIAQDDSIIRTKSFSSTINTQQSNSRQKTVHVN
jgi:hypothetical protein